MIWLSNKRYLVLVLFTLLWFDSFSQQTNCQVKHAGRFNLLFDNYYTLDEHMVISAKNHGVSFDGFADSLTGPYWKEGCVRNLDIDDVLKNPVDDIETMSIYINSAGVVTRSDDYHEVLLKTKQDTVRLQRKLERLTKYTPEVIDELSKDYSDHSFQSKNMSSFVNESIEKTTVQSFLFKSGDIRVKAVSEVSKLILNDYARQIEKIIQEKSIRQLVFFIHGYNVPMGLAQMQGNETLKLIEKANNKNQQILFVRVFWDSGNLKTLRIKYKDSDHKSLKRIVYRDKLTPKNILNWQRARHKAMLSGTEMRKLLNLLDNEAIKDLDNIQVITHSLGGIVATNIIANGSGLLNVKMSEESIVDGLFKLQDQRTLELYRDSAYDKLDKKDLFLISKMLESPLPDKNINFFLNAPAMSGSLFRSLKIDNSNKYLFGIGYNYYDPALSKHFVFKKWYTSGRRARFYGSTTLGNNYDNEAFRLKKFFSESDNVEIKLYNTSNYFRHDIFQYMKHPLFMESFKSFISNE
jgi:hypothetical protein